MLSFSNVFIHLACLFSNKSPLVLRIFSGFETDCRLKLVFNANKVWISPIKLFFFCVFMSHCYHAAPPCGLHRETQQVWCFWAQVWWRFGFRAHCSRQVHLVPFSLCMVPNSWRAWLLISFQKFSKEMFWLLSTSICSRTLPRPSSFSTVLAIAGIWLEIMDWNWVVFMVGPLSAALWNSVTNVLRANSSSEYFVSISEVRSQKTSKKHNKNN